jgi:hypothetical protein
VPETEIQLAIDQRQHSVEGIRYRCKAVWTALGPRSSTHRGVPMLAIGQPDYRVTYDADDTQSSVVH